MKHPRHNGFLCLVALCSVLVAAGAFAEDVKDESRTDPMEFTNANCDLQGYKSEVRVFSPAISVPDNNATGVVIGPIILPDDGTLIADVVMDLKMSHTWLGDIIATLRYDVDCDGTADVSTIILCRPGRTIACGTGGSGAGCSSNLVCANTYLFDDTGLSLPTTGCTSATNIPGGCYRPTGLGAGLLSAFDNLRKGGCWTLHVSDNAGADLGTICEWSIHILNQAPIGVESTTWSNLKTLFQ